MIGAWAALVGPASAASLRMPRIFADHMVLQQGRAAVVWGQAAPGETVTIAFAGNTASVSAGPDGRWRAELPAMSASAEGREMVVTCGDEKLTFTDVLVGEVWFCSGQSNMQWNVANSVGASETIADTNNHPQIRLCTVARVTSAVPLEDTEVNWAVCGRGTVPYFSAVAYYFGRDLHRELNVPVGLIHASWGGTPGEAWTSPQALGKLDFMPGMFEYWRRQIESFNEPAAQQKRQEAMADWTAAAEAARARGEEPSPRPEFADPGDSPHRPGSLYNGMVEPVAPFAIRGAIWYQGESNASRWFQYRRLMTALIEDWRRTWDDAEMPFLIVQLANYMDVQDEPYQKGATWPHLREAQRQAAELPNVGLASAIDMGEADDIHPRNKLPVGHRLALAARAIAYGQDVVHSGPAYKSMRRKGGKLVLSFDHVGGGLVARGGELRGFGLAGQDGRWVWADAQIVGDTVVLSSDEVAHPESYCYAWANNPIGNLYNVKGLPAVPFSVDTTVLVTSSPLDEQGRAKVTIRTGSDHPILLDLSVDDGARIEGDAAVQITAEREARVSIVAADAGQPLRLAVRQEGREPIEHWLRPAEVTVGRSDSVQIDGDLFDWPSDGQLGARWFESDDSRFAPQVRLSWSGETLLIGGVLPVGEVVAAGNPRQFWNESCVELFIDPTAGGHQSGWSDTSHQFWFCPVRDEQGEWRLYAGEFKRSRAVAETLYDDTRVRTAMEVQDGSVVFEIALPATVVGKAPAAGEQWRIGIALQRAGRKADWTIQNAISAAWPRSKERGLLDGTRQWGVVTFQNE